MGTRSIARILRQNLSTIRYRVGTDIRQPSTRPPRGNPVAEHEVEIVFRRIGTNGECRPTEPSLLQAATKVKSSEQEGADEDVRRWVRNVFVPALVTAFLEERKKSEAR